MSEPSISKLPWAKAVRNGRQVLDPDGNTVAMFRGPNAWRDAAHSLSCVNNLAGLNPEGVRDLIAACEKILPEVSCLLRNRGLNVETMGPGHSTKVAYDELAAALAKVKGQQQ